jgi:hypothetical protein
MGIEDNWRSFIELTGAKADSHGKAARYWDRIHHILSLSLIFLPAFTTVSTLIPISNSQYAGALLGGLATLIAALNGSLNPSFRRQQQMEASRGFRALMLKMVSVETEREYEELWKEYNKELLREPFLPAKFKVKDKTEFSMSPRLQMVVALKESDSKGITSELESRLSVIDKSFENSNDGNDDIELGAVASTKVELTPLLE